MTTSMCGDATLGLIEAALDDGARQMAVLMRHSARTFHRDIHDLENQLTDEGRDLCQRLGSKLPQGLELRGYASPAQRCLETAQIVLDTYRDQGGTVSRVRPIEAFGPFYALDQQRMWKGLSAAEGMHAYVQQWLDGELPVGIMLPTPLAASALLQQLAARLNDKTADGRLTFCVSHDLSLLMLRSEVLKQGPELQPVEFLDALVLYRKGDSLLLASHLGPPQPVSDELRLR